MKDTYALWRLFRFGLTGTLTTSISYGVFVGLIHVGLHYALASVAAWLSGLMVGFAVNRRFTFGIAGPERRKRDFGWYVAGAVLQLLAGLAGYVVLIGRLKLDPTPAFIVNAVLTTTVSYLFLRFVTFRRAVDA